MYRSCAAKDRKNVIFRRSPFRKAWTDESESSAARETSSDSHGDPRSRAAIPHSKPVPMFIPKLAFPLALAAALITGPLTMGQSVTSSTTTSKTTTRGLVSEMGPDALVIRTESNTAPIRYSSSATTTFVDEAGVPVARELVASGLPVTVTYIRDGERLIAQQVTVHRQTTTTPSPTVIERSTTITPPPVVVEKKVYVDRPVIVEKKVPVEVEKKVYVDRPVVVEKPAPPPVVIEKKTTTTTTTTTPGRKED